MEEENEIEKTSMYSLDAVEEALVSSTLKEVCQALREKGYNEINQLVGYLMDIYLVITMLEIRFQKLIEVLS